MLKKESKNKIKELVDNLLLVNLFTVIFFAIFFIFAVIMQINGIHVFLGRILKEVPEFLRDIYLPNCAMVIVF